MIGEYCDLPFLSPEPNGVLPKTEATPSKSFANNQLQTEHANGQFNLVKGQTELADGHAKRQIEHAKRQIEHTDGQTERTTITWQHVLSGKQNGKHAYDQ